MLPKLEAAQKWFYKTTISIPLIQEEHGEFLESWANVQHLCEYTKRGGEWLLIYLLGSFAGA